MSRWNCCGLRGSGHSGATYSATRWKPNTTDSVCNVDQSSYTTPITPRP
ncbi:hypothetical protein LZG04_12370 [Saccharothrix sp. S26]|nr:hypothetical protein [Saccharothrix sp. S26]MCE6995588.1 hypothetical protein [Saccharothrix sp. S26]